eukprot:TRINITY_DN1569_c0_g1_i1.p1 TRINITY_DN1569_c0_g1~~TRINITY_DN1569_c0_g1_i1.p1  ORF type:complete len:122 (-),score=66.54 TRINITY_DN1569_c0_g1_i1:385-750(-)
MSRGLGDVYKRQVSTQSTGCEELIEASKPDRFFRVPLIDLTARYGQPVPPLLLALGEQVALRAALDGIFRTSGNADEIRRVVSLIDSGDVGDIAWDERDPHLAPALLKQWLRDLPEPLFYV